MSVFKPLTEAPGMGRVEVVKTGEGDPVNTAFNVVDAPDLIVSNMGDGSINPDYPQELQPRDRTSLTSKMQVLNIAKTLNPEALAGNPFSGKGSPIIGPDNIVESGNGRTLGLLRAYGSGMADDYRAWLVAHAADYGLSPEVIEGMRQPVLVRVRMDDIDRVKFAEDSNKDVKSAVPDKPMFEAAVVENYFADAKDIDQLMLLVRYRGYDDTTYLGKMVGDMLMKLVKGQMPLTEYQERIDRLIPPGSQLRDDILSRNNPTFFYGLTESPVASALRDPATAYNIVIKGYVGGIWDLAQQWKEQGENKKAVAVQLKGIYEQAARWSDSTYPNFYFSDFWLNVTDGILSDSAFKDAIALVEGKAQKLTASTAPSAHADATSVGNGLLNARESKEKASIALQGAAAALIRKFGPDAPTFLHQNLYRATKEQYMEYLKRLGTAISHGRMGHHSAKVEGVANISRQFSAKGKQEIRDAINRACVPITNRISLATMDIMDNQPADADTIASLYHGIEIHPNVIANSDRLWGDGVLRAVIEFSLKLAGGKISTLKKIIPAKSGERSYAQRSGVIALSSTSGPDVLAHEIGHHFEFSNYNLPLLAQEYLRSRMTSKRPRLLQSLCPGYNYKRDEKAIEDKLSEPYIGKVYGGDLSMATSTEVYSMGFQYLWDMDHGAQSVMNNDGLLEFVMGVIKGVHSGKY